MTARPLMMVLAGSLVLVPLAYAQHASPRGGGGGGAAQSYSPSPSSSSSSSSSGGSWSAAPVAMTSDHATSRGGGSSSSGSSHASGSSHSGGASARSGGSTAESRHPSGSSASPGAGSRTPATIAERRHPRAGTGTGGHGVGGGGFYYPYDYGYYYPGWGWGSYWWPYGSYYDGWYGGGYWGYPYGGWGMSHNYVHRDTGAVRILVNPSEARVYVDGYYAGTVDDFDGLFQRLNVAPGRHEITLKLEGYKTHRMKVYVPFEGTLKLRYDMEKGAGETFEDLAVNIPEKDLQRERERAREESAAEQEDKEEAAGPATLHLSVTPADASVYVDGAFRGTGREAASIQLPPGRHRLEIVRPGYRTVERDVETAPGEPTELNVELEKTSI